MMAVNALSGDFRLALRSIVRQRRRSVIAIIAIGFGVVAMMLATGFIEWIFWATREGVAVTQIGHVQVVQPGYYENGQADPFAFLLPENAPALTTLRGVRGVDAIAPRLEFNGLVSYRDSTLSFIAKGVDPASDPSLRYLIMVQGDRLDSDDDKGILMGTGLAANLGASVGDTVVLLAGTRTGGMNAVEAIIRGLASTSMKAYDDTMLLVPIEMARRLLRVSGAHLWVASLQDTDMTASVIEDLKLEPSLQRYTITPWTKLADFYNKTVDLLSQQVNVVRLIIAIIIVLSISNTMTMSVMERTVEIGTSMALGVGARRILALFLMEGVLLGAIGGIGGIAFGYLLAAAISWLGIPMPPSPGMSRGFTAAIIITPRIVVDALLLAVTTTLLASIYPAWRASRLLIVDALRHNR